MRFLADESCDNSVVRALRGDGHDVVAVCEIFPRAEDEVVMEMAFKQKRILLTEDKDFGQLVYAYHQRTKGVIFIRFPSMFRKRLAVEVAEIVRERKEKLISCFVVVQPGRVRISKIQIEIKES